MKKTAVNNGESLKSKLAWTIVWALMALALYIGGIIVLANRQQADKITEPSIQSVTIVDLPNQQST